MGIVNRGFNQTALNGSIGAVTYVTRKGITVARQKVPAKLSYRRTVRSLTPRMRWMNVVRVWQALNSVGWHPSFLNKTGLQTDFNMFTKANSRASVFLTKSIVSANGGVVAGLQITNGGLPTVGGAFGEGAMFRSTISMGGMSVGASTTVATFSTAIVENNEGWRNHDQLTVVILRQVVDSLGTPRISPVIHQIYLDVDDESTLLGDILEPNALSVIDGNLGLGGPVTIGAAAFVHSSGEGDNFDVSSEFLTMSSEQVLQQFTGNNALMTAIDSYGGLDANMYLIPEPSDNVPLEA